MSGSVKLNTPASGSVILTPASSIASDVTVQVPSVSDTVTLNAASQTLTNKTLTNPVISGTISDGTNSTSSTNCIQGSAKAWVNFNGNSGAIRSSYNVSSLTRQSAGQYTISFTNALADANYSVVGMGSQKFTVESHGIVTLNWGTVPTSSAFLLTVINTANASIDNTYTSVAVFR